jgi:mono/diheme cytochrome c family protein
VPAAAKNLKSPIPANKETVGAGMMIYMQRCQSCHGERGDGKGEKASELSVMPADFTDTSSMKRLTDGELFWQITQGRLPMPSFQDRLTEEERWQVVAYIRTFARKPGTPGQGAR